MRDIDEFKFRGWAPDVEQWVVGSLIVDFNGGDMQIINIADGETYYVDPRSVGQNTGIKDSNGNPIFEGDYLRAFNPKNFDNTTWEVTFERGAYRMITSDEDERPKLLGTSAKITAGDYDYKIKYVNRGDNYMGFRMAWEL